MPKRIKVAILEDHPATADGYRYRLEKEPDIEVTSVSYYGEDLLPTLAKHPADVLLMDMQLVASATDSTPYNTQHLLPEAQAQFPDLAVLVISQHDSRALVNVMLQAGADGYVLKDDHEAYHDLPSLIRMIANGGMYLSARVRDSWLKSPTGGLAHNLSPRQVEALSLCSAYPNENIPKLAVRMSIAAGTLRATLWDSYRKLGVNSREAAVAKTRQLGILPPDINKFPE